MNNIQYATIIIRWEMEITKLYYMKIATKSLQKCNKKETTLI